MLGSPGDSLEVVLDGEKAGLWTDRATGDGGDIFDLIAAYLGINVHTDFPRADEAADLLGRSRSVPRARPRRKRRSTSWPGHGQVGLLRRRPAN
jgi:putative DNA primase/helicase